MVFITHCFKRDRHTVEEYSSIFCTHYSCMVSYEIYKLFCLILSILVRFIWKIMFENVMKSSEYSVHSTNRRVLLQGAHTVVMTLIYGSHLYFCWLNSFSGRLSSELSYKMFELVKINLMLVYYALMIGPWFVFSHVLIWFLRPLDPLFPLHIVNIIF